MAERTSLQDHTNSAQAQDTLIMNKLKVRTTELVLMKTKLEVNETLEVVLVIKAVNPDDTVGCMAVAITW